MTIKKATTIMCISMLFTTHTQNIESWCQKVLDLLDLTFAELLGTTWNISLDISPLFSSNEGGNK